MCACVFCINPAKMISKLACVCTRSSPFPTPTPKPRACMCMCPLLIYGPLHFGGASVCNINHTNAFDIIFQAATAAAAALLLLAYIFIKCLAAHAHTVWFSFVCVCECVNGRGGVCLSISNGYSGPGRKLPDHRAMPREHSETPNWRIKRSNVVR